MAQEKSMFSDQKLSELNLSEWLIENCATMGMTKATKIQAKAIPHILNGKDVIARAKTGSGKTAAFALPILEHLSQDPYGIFAIVLTPTRELACQIGDQFIALSSNTGFTTAIAYGGSGYITNTGDIEDRPHILIATPGRLADLIECGMEFDVDDLQYLVIDEADQLLLSKGFKSALNTIFNRIPSRDNNRRTLLFSATLDKSMKEIFNVLKYNPNNENDKKRVKFIETSTHKLSTTSNINQTYCFVPEISKETYLITILTELTDISKYNKSVIIFISSKEYCMIMARLLKNFPLKISELHSNMKQKKRLNELMRFRSGKTNVLVSTDLASRGLDIPRVAYVINFDIPRSGFEYIHRIGRCGRIDRCGTAITFVSQYDIKLLQQIEKHIKCKLTSFNTNKFKQSVLAKMERVLIIRAGIINSIETKYLIDPHHFKRDATLRWDGKFTDPRILGKINLKNKDKDNNNDNNQNSLYKDFRNAFDNNYQQIDETKEQNEQQKKEDAFLSDLKKKEKKNKKLSLLNDRKNKHHENDDKDIDEDDDSDLDANMMIIDEEVRLKNEEITKKNKTDKLENVGNDYHDLPNYQSFRYGKQGKKLLRLDRMNRAQKFQQKRARMELKRSKRENRQSKLGLFSIYDDDTNETKKMTMNNNTNKNGKWFKKKLKQTKNNKKQKKKSIKKDQVKISKSLRKKLSEKEQQQLRDRKRSWFKGENIEWS